jgi:hypothetical protein
VRDRIENAPSFRYIGRPIVKPSNSTPAEFDEMIVVNAEMVGNLVEDGAGNFAADLIRMVEFLEKRMLKNDDAVRKP